ncbi:MAG: hypothetical protein IPK08_04000 [Bacteroidetes bacterium]|nr:hypothetical protein [Bacteroidota bacterium]
MLRGHSPISLCFTRRITNWYYTTSIIPVRVASNNLPDCTYPSWNSMSCNYMSTSGDTTFNSCVFATGKPGQNEPIRLLLGFLREDNVAKKFIS